METLIADFIAYGTEHRRYTYHTQKGYRSALRDYAEYLNGSDPLQATAAVITAYDLARSRTIRPRTRARNLCALRSFYRWLVEEKGELKSNPASRVKIPELDKSSRTCPKAALRLRLLESCERIKDEHRGIMAHALFGVMFNAGLRIDETCDLLMQDLIFNPPPASELQGPYLIVQKGKGNKYREIPLNDDLIEWLKAWLNVRKATVDNVFVRTPTRPVSQYIIRSMFREVKAAAGVRDAGLTPHSLRHSFATALHEQRVDLATIQELLGHSSIDTTRDYVHVDDKRLHSAVQKLNQASPKKPGNERSDHEGRPHHLQPVAMRRAPRKG